MKKVRDISPYSIRMPDELKEKLTDRAKKNGRSLNSEMVMILQAAVDEEAKPKNINELAQLESEKFKELFMETIKRMYERGDNE
ncbi:Arc family DNA-binding protein [Xenorhabdus bovienii]|uniref:Arc family DNA-binding protein n=1 Tax=Xenorhabdus bovienii TaxID=40576 RepID=UPI001EE00ACE|nr:Arc family DNA-binding protein [Xenorhabdus bovienii]MCG3470824.1 Arc family DNA-binding protein [Xenorhabdus bovienii]